MLDAAWEGQQQQLLFAVIISTVHNLQKSSHQLNMNLQFSFRHGLEKTSWFFAAAGCFVKCIICWTFKQEWDQSDFSVIMNPNQLIVVSGPWPASGALEQVDKVIWAATGAALPALLAGLECWSWVASVCWTICPSVRQYWDRTMRPLLPCFGSDSSE